jgi:hypothetical protein
VTAHFDEARQDPPGRPLELAGILAAATGTEER